MTEHWKNKSCYFNHVDPRFDSLWASPTVPVWEALLKIKTWQKDFLKTVEASTQPLAGMQFQAGERPSYWFSQTRRLTQNWVDHKNNIFLAKGCFLEAGSTIYAGSILLENCEVRQGAYLRGELIVGPHCVLGHCTEAKTAILLGGVEAGHFTYIGNSIIGESVNIGAGTKLSNLPFRSFEAKRQQTFAKLKFVVGGQTIKHGFSKFGSVIGEGCETGCNTTLSPLVFLGQHCWVWPNLHVPPGVYASKLKFRTTEDCWQQRLQH